MGNFLNFIVTTIFITFLLTSYCLSLDDNENSVITIKIENNTSEKCLVPSGIDSEKIEVLCYDVEKAADDNGQYKLVEDVCSEKTQVMLTRCQVGYINKNTNDNHYLNKCINGKWDNENHNNDDCKLICGQNLESKIEKPAVLPLVYKGIKINSANVPWHVGIYGNFSENSPNFEFICSGSIVHSNIILSMGYCFKDHRNGKTRDPSLFMIGAGKRFRSYKVNEEHDQFARIKTIHIFENPGEIDRFKSGIAVVVLDSNLQYNNFVEPVCINLNPHKDIPLFNKNIMGYLYGWGATSQEDSPSSELLNIKLKPISKEECKKMAEPQFGNELEQDDEFCAINELENSSACKGDSGGGLVIKTQDKNNIVTLIGIVASSLNPSKYCSDESITLFKDVQYYKDFIKKFISKGRNTKEESLINAQIKIQG